MRFKICSINQGLWRKTPVQGGPPTWVFVGVQRWINVSTLEMKEELLPDIGKVRIKTIEVSSIRKANWLVRSNLLQARSKASASRLRHSGWIYTEISRNWQARSCTLTATALPGTSSSSSSISQPGGNKTATPPVLARSPQQTAAE